METRLRWVFSRKVAKSQNRRRKEEIKFSFAPLFAALRLCVKLSSELCDL